MVTIFSLSSADLLSARVRAERCFRYEVMRYHEAYIAFFFHLQAIRYTGTRLSSYTRHRVTVQCYNTGRMLSPQQPRRAGEGVVRA